MTLRKLLLAATALVLPAAAQAQQVSGIYIGAGAGLNWLQDARLNSTGPLADSLRAAGFGTSGKISFDLGWVGVASLGYGFGNGLRAEVEGNYRENDVDKIRGFAGTPVTRVSGTSRSYGVMANVFYDFDFGLNFGAVSLLPYVGGGIGWIWREFDDVRGSVLGGEIRSSGTQGRFGYQGIAGLSMPINTVPGLAVTAEYRFLGTARQTLDSSSTNDSFTITRTGTRSDNYNHSIMLGIRYAFGQRPAAPPVVAPVAPVAPAPQVARTYLVFFDFDRADLTDRARQIIAEAAQNSRTAGVTRLEVSGHADRSGTPQYNQRLSERRAQAVAAELERRGVSRSQMVIQAFGESRPLVPTADGVREPQNRRVEIVLR